jgi:hypothetical protein
MGKYSIDLNKIPTTKPTNSPDYLLDRQVGDSPIPLKEQVKKHDYFAELTKDFTSIYDARFFICTLAGSPQSELFQESGFYPVDVDKFADLCGLTYLKAFHMVKELALKYKTTQQSVRISPREVRLTTLLYDIEVNDHINTIKIMWNSLIIPLVSGSMPKGQWCRYDGRLAKSSTHRSVAIGDYLQRHSWVFSRFKNLEDKVLVVPTEELREIASCTDTYPEFKHFKANVLLPALRDINTLTSLRLYIVKGNKRNVTFGVG